MHRASIGRRRLLALVTVAVMLLAACSDDDSEGAATGADPAADEAVTPGIWTTFGYDLANTRFNPDEVMLTDDNVGELAPLWHLDDIGDVSSTPSVADGVAYFGTWEGEAYAVDAVDGEEIWSTEVEGGQIMSSATVTEDAVFVASNSGLSRLDRENGEVEWSMETSDHPIAISPVAPVVADDIVLQGVASGELMMDLEEYSFEGTMAAYDIDTGEVLWERLFTEEDEGAGVGIWSNPAVDLERGHLYVGTGNTYEPPQAELSNSAVAMDLEDGSVVWSTQFTHPDIWSAAHPGGLDADVGAGPNLWSSGDQDLVGMGDKRGDYYALDRDTGEIVWETDMTDGSLLGGVIGTSAQADGTIFVGSNNGDEETNMPGGDAMVVALDSDDGSILWQEEVPGSIFAPITVTPGLVFVGTTASQFHIFDAETGEELWSMDTPDQVGSGATVVDGVVYWGYGFSLFGGGEAGGLYALSPGGEEGAGEVATNGDDDHAGAAIYRNRCATCHGASGQGAVGPALAGISDRMDPEEQLEVVRQGSGGQMPAFEGVLDDEELEEVVAYTRDAL